MVVWRIWIFNHNSLHFDLNLDPIDEAKNHFLLPYYMLRAQSKLDLFFCFCFFFPGIQLRFGVTTGAGVRHGCYDFSFWWKYRIFCRWGAEELKKNDLGDYTPESLFGTWLNLHYFCCIHCYILFPICMLYVVFISQLLKLLASFCVFRYKSCLSFILMHVWMNSLRCWDKRGRLGLQPPRQTVTGLHQKRY